MAFYIVSNPANASGEAGGFVAAVVRAGGRVQARKLITESTGHSSTELVVTKLEDGRDVPNGVILADYADGE
ncbi:hypothetical protein ACFW6C_07460 [Streptomyces fungicidicus]|uniref:hypothetical protein n=1 Tax=Streptomyces fungicidicus TaxID=68203 RepID=UPI0036C99E96